MSWQREVLIFDMVSEPLNQAQETLADLDRTDNIQDNRVEMTSFLNSLEAKRTLKFLVVRKLLSTCKTERKYEY